MRLCLWPGLLAGLLSSFNLAARAGPALPNFIVVLCDNLGYGDLGCYGSKVHRTPAVDRLAAEGIRFTSAYAASGVCTPSRAALLTGCYPRRVNLHASDTGGLVLQPVSPKGLHPDEVTLAELLKAAGYATACIGKWHLGDQLEFLPTRQGFDEFFGVPYSEDMTPRVGRPWPPLPLMRGERVIEAPVNRDLLTQRYTAEAIRFIENHRTTPFFLYLPQAMPGSSPDPFASERFKGKSANGPWGDAVEELDWSTGEILRTLRQLGLDERTLVVFTSDNGAPRKPPPRGSNLPLKGWGYTTDEGGMRIPLLARWPGKIPAGMVCDELVSLMDLLPTFARLAGSKLIIPPNQGDAIRENRTLASPWLVTSPQDGISRPIDGRDIWPLMAGRAEADSRHEAFYYYHLGQLQAVRDARWKLYLPLPRKAGAGKEAQPVAAALFDLRKDLAETNEISASNPDVVARLKGLAELAREDLGDLDRPGKNQRPAGMVTRPTPRLLNVPDR